MAVPDAPPLSAAALTRINERFEQAFPEQILRWATRFFPTGAILTCSFQHDGVVLAHMLRTIKPDVPVLFINTGAHFDETLTYRDTIVKLLDLNLIEAPAQMPPNEFQARYGTELYRTHPDLCCKINKVDPLLAALRGVRAWINGRRRDQTPERQHMGHVEIQGSIIKINPLARWTSKDTFRYLHAHNLPLHPLFEKGYTSIGCKPCTMLPIAGHDERSGRWVGSPKRECGIHTVLDSSE